MMHPQSHSFFPCDLPFTLHSSPTAAGERLAYANQCEEPVPRACAERYTASLCPLCFTDHLNPQPLLAGDEVLCLFRDWAVAIGRSDAPNRPFSSGSFSL